MKGLVQFIKESLINETANTTAIVNKIKKEFQKEFGDKVTIGSGRANYQQLYDVYIYDMDINTLRKVNDILKKHLPIWKGFTDEELQKKIDDKKEFFDRHKDDKYVSLDRYPVEFFRFTSRDLKKILNESCKMLELSESYKMLELSESYKMLELSESYKMLELSESYGKMESSFDDLCRYTKTDPKKEMYVLSRNIKDKKMYLKKFNDGEEASQFIDTLRPDKGDEKYGHYQGMSNDESYIKRIMNMHGFRAYKKIVESCEAPEHKIVKDAAGNWRIKGTPGKGTNTDKEGLWAAKYKTEEDAKKALAAYHINK